MATWLFITPAQKQLVVEKSETIQLTLADGEIIDLNKEEGNISTQNISLQNVGGSLSYQDNGNAVGMNTVTVPTGMDYRINLSDGSKVWMNSKTKLEFPSQFAADKREISLSGEAYLEIAKDPSKPFFVKLPDGTVQVVGTEFNINTYQPSVTKVALVEGGVKLIANDSSVLVKPGKETVYNSGNKSFQTAAFTAKKTLSWRTGMYYFDEAPLSEIAPVVERWYGIKIQVDNPALTQKVFAGALNKHEPIEDFIDNLKNISKIEGYFDKAGILHFK